MSDRRRGAYADRHVTAQRCLIADVASETEGAFTVETLTERARRMSPRIGLATVYRAVAAMTETGFLERVGERDGTALYAARERTDHHHHLVCVECGSLTATACPIGETVLARAREVGFVVTEHDVSIYGLCAACRGKRAEGA